MFCSKCGKENNDTAKFCAYCGAELKASAVKDNTKMLSYVLETDNAKRVSGMKASDIILLVVYIIWVIPWTGIVIGNYETTKVAFEWLDSKNIAMGCYMLPYVLALLIVIFGIIQVFQHKYHITLGVLAVILPVVVRIGKAVFNEVSFDTAQLIGYRVFLVYGQEWIPTLIIGGLLTVFLYAKSVQK